LFILSKVVGYFLIPPGIIILILFISLLLILKNKKIVVSFLVFISMSSFYLLSIDPIKDKILIPLEDKYPFPNIQNLDCDVIVALGGGYYPVSPENQNKPDLKPAVTRRLITTFKVWKVQHKKIILSGGRPIYKYFSEAEIMAGFLKLLGVDESFLILEQNSKNTFENAKLTKIIMEENQWSKACLVTSAYHMPRAVKIFKYFGINVVPVPSDYRTTRIYTWFSLLSQSSVFDNSARGIREYIGLYYYKLRYGI